jgi:hypothetical protein
MLLKSAALFNIPHPHLNTRFIHFNSASYTFNQACWSSATTAQNELKNGTNRQLDMTHSSIATCFSFSCLLVFLYLAPCLFHAAFKSSGTQTLWYVHIHACACMKSQVASGSRKHRGRPCDTLRPCQPHDATQLLHVRRTDVLCLDQR